jgi:hypothetical protein
VYKLLLCFLFLLCSAPVFAQRLHTVQGMVQDTAGVPLAGTIVKLKTATDSLTTTTDNQGLFNFSKVKTASFSLNFRLIGFNEYTQHYQFSPQLPALKIQTIHLKEILRQLKAVNIVDVNPIKVKEDTVEYKASAYKVREGSPVEDLVKKLPGLTVDKDGNITAQGKAVTKVRVNGKDYFGGDVQTATQNLPANIVENIQVIDDYGDQANLTGIKSGEPDKIINITIQKNKNKGYFGQGTIAAGNNDRFAGRVSANKFKDAEQISVLGSVNNTNSNLFNFGSNASGTGGSTNGNGITTATALGLNYRNDFGKKVTLYGSYSYAKRDNNTISSSFEQRSFQDYAQFNTGNSQNITNNANHRLNLNLEYKIDTANYLKVVPNVSYSSTASNSTNLINSTKPSVASLQNNAAQSRATSPAAGANVLFNHKFSKRGRNFSVNASFDHSSRDQNRDVNNNTDTRDSTGSIPQNIIQLQNQQINNDNQNTRTTARASYMEPLNKVSFLELSYAYNNSLTQSLRTTNDIDPGSGTSKLNTYLSNNYKYSFVTNRVGLNLRVIQKKYNYTLGLVAQPSHLNGQSVGKNIYTSTSYFYLIPTARFVYNFSRSHSFTFNYGGSSSEPGFSQLQPIRDSSNLQNIIVGNPYLKASFTNRLSLQYNQFDVASGNSLFTNLSFNETQNQIVTNNISAKNSTGQEINYLNTNGFYNASGYYTFSKPFTQRKYTLTFNGNANFNNNISYTNSQKNIGKNWVLSQGAKFRLDLEDIIDAEFNADYSYNTTRYSIATTPSTNAKTLLLSVNGRNFFLKNWTLGYDLTKTINSGYSSTIKANPTLLNTYIERRFLRNNLGAARFQGFDLFNQNTGISRNVTANSIVDSRNNRLGRYYLLSFTYRIQKFAGRRPRMDFGGPENNRGENGSRRNGGGSRSGGGRGRN